VVADIGCRRDVLTRPIVSALPVLPLPPPALPSGSNGASPASTWPIPQTERRPQSIVLRFFRNPQEDGARPPSWNGENAPCLRGIRVPLHFFSSRSLGPRYAMSWTLICPSGRLAVTDQPTRHPQPVSQRSIGATIYGASSVSLAPSSPSRHSAALSPGYSPTAFSSAAP
jgi:hypothetical protein